MTEEATHEIEDVEEVTEEVIEETTQDEVAKPVLARDTMMDSIYAKGREVYSSDEQEVSEEETEETEETVETNEEPEMVELKIDGEIVMKSASEVEAEGGVSTYQKTLAADKRFKEAAAEKAILTTMRTDLQRERLEIEELKNVVVEHPEISDEETDEFITNIYSGDEDKARTAFKNVISKIRSTPQQKTQEPVNTQDVIDGAVYQLDRKNGIKQFEKDFKNLNTDPKLKAMVNDATARISNENPNKEPSVIIMEAAKEVNDWVNSFTPQEGILEDQLDRKKKIKTIKTAKTRMKKETGYKPKTQAEIFAETKASRSH